MINWLKSTDYALFQIINSEWVSPFLDRIMPLLTNQDGGILLILAILVAVAILGRRRGIIAVATALVAVAIIDPTGYYILKQILARPRPCHLEIGRLLVECGTGYAMPSLHAANGFGVFTALVVHYRWKAAPLCLLSAGVAYSRVYVGVHWPSDVLAGAVFGSAVGLVVGLLALKFLPGKKSDAQS